MQKDKHNKKRLSSLSGRFLAHDDRLSEIFTYVVFSAGPILGSAVSFAVNIGAVGGAIEAARRIIPVSRDSAMLLLAAPIYLYCLACCLSLALNPEPEWRYLVPLLTFLLFPFLYSSWRLSRKATVARAATSASMIACYGALALAVVQFHILGMRAEGGAGNAIVFATVVCLAAAVSLAGAFVRSGMTSLPFFGAYCAGGIAILYSGSRITWLALFASTAAILWIFRERRHAWTSAAAVSCAAIAIGALTVAGSQIVPVRVAALVQDWQQLREHGNYDSSLGRRAELWDIGIAAIGENPILGHGPQATRTLITEGFEKVGIEVHYSHFHNGFLNAWIEAGAIGALSLAAVFVMALHLAARTIARTVEVEARLGAVMLVAVSTTYVISGMTGVLVGHDIIDAMLMAYLAVGAYLAAGTSLLGLETAAPQARAGGFADVRSELENDSPVEPAQREQRRDEQEPRQRQRNDP